MLRLLFIFILLFAASQTMAQTIITWETLADVEFTREYFDEADAYFYYPHFGPSIKALEGQEVLLNGYMLPIDPKQGFYVLSKNPFAACFFCGSSGPESIVELILKPDHPKFKMDEVITMKGKLRLNKDDLNFCNYILEEAEVAASIYQGY